MSSLRRDESGSALVTAIIVTGLMLGIGLATMSWADNGFRTSAEQRVRESGFNLGEAVLKAQVRELSRNWPKLSTPAPPCPSSTQPTRCPSEATLSQSYTSVDYAAGYTWSTQVQDNGGQVTDFYSTSLAAGQPAYDANGDGKLWVRAETTVRGKTRRLLTQVRAQRVPLPFPRNAVTAGFLQTRNNGNKVIIDTKGRSGQAGDIRLRCNQPGSDGCKDSRKKAQVSPDTTYTGYTGGDAMSLDDLEALRGQAKANGTYYTSCPANPSGAIVFVESGNCSYTGGGSANSATSPGMFVINNGTFALGGNFTFFGLVYARNAQGSGYSDPPVVSLQGTALITGAVAVDGYGRVYAGSSGLNLIYDSNVFSLVMGYGSAESIPGMWRELGPS